MMFRKVLERFTDIRRVAGGGAARLLGIDHVPE